MTTRTRRCFAWLPTRVQPSRTLWLAWYEQRELWDGDRLVSWVRRAV